ncbi:endonuclease domain-containing protein [Devosia oryziradicis]|uniref:Endonuclease domain-containing protein n=2 Tax=Devosia oryziradicis TaxID=2801335 RepID=A0ABX7BYF1_9HYPH|nr:endonuclease domain-containing protein [Devosia oryziradicis]QQR36990.1 endonuclease domain-containing protein [Devosia oryziradicis]
MRSPDFIRERAKTLRRAMTQPERTLWALLRRNRMGLHFRRQHPIGPFVLDFYCATAKLCIELDGPSHTERAEYDQRRTAWLGREGVRVLRFSVEEVETRSAVVLAAIAQAAPPSTA